jgi:hypothetical protein
MPASQVLFGQQKQEAATVKSAATILRESMILQSQVRKMLEGIASTDPTIIRKLNQHMKVTESLAHLVMANGMLDNPAQDPRLKRAEEDRDPNMPTRMEEVDPEELAVAEAPATDEGGASYKVSGVEDEEKKKAMNEAIVAAVKAAGGKLMLEEAGDEAPIVYVGVGTPTEVTDGVAPVDEFGAPTAAEAEEMKNDIDNPSPDAKSAETFSTESIRRFTMTAGIKALIESQFRKSKRLQEQKDKAKK